MAAPQLLPIQARLYRVIVALVVVGAVPIILAFTVGSRFLDGSGAYSVFNDILFPVWSLTWGGGMVWQICRFWPKLDLMRIVNRSGTPLFDVIKDRKNSGDFEVFIKALQERIASSHVQ